MKRQQITREEAAEIFGVSISTFKRRMECGLAPRAIEGTRRWSKMAVEAAARGDATPGPIRIETSAAPPPIVDDFEARWSAMLAR